MIIHDSTLSRTQRRVVQTTWCAGVGAVPPPTRWSLQGGGRFFRALWGALAKAILAVVIVSAVIGAPRVASATTVVAMDEPTITRYAQAVVFGTVITTRVQKSRKGLNMTLADVQVYESVKGPGWGTVITVHMPGGELNGLVQDVPGTVPMVDGQMWVAFLEGDGTNFIPVGLGYGMIPVRRLPSGDLVVGRRDFTIGLAHPVGSVPSGDILRVDDVPLQTYLDRLRSHLDDEPGKPGPTHGTDPNTSPNGGVP